MKDQEGFRRIAEEKGLKVKDAELIADQQGFKPDEGAVPYLEIEASAKRIAKGEKPNEADLALQEKYPKEFSAEVDRIKPEAVVEAKEEVKVTEEVPAEKVKVEEKVTEEVKPVEAEKPVVPEKVEKPVAKEEVKVEEKVEKPTPPIEKKVEPGVKEEIVSPKVEAAKPRIEKLKPESKKIEEAHPKEDIDFTKEIVEEGWFEPTGEVWDMRLDLGIPVKEVRKGLADIKDGKNTAPAKKIIAALKEAKEKGGFPVMQGFGPTLERSRLTFEEIKKAREEAPKELTEQEAKLSESIPDETAKAINEFDITLENVDKVTKDWGFPKEEVKQIKKYLNEAAKREAAGIAEAEAAIGKGEKLEQPKEVKKPEKAEPKPAERVPGETTGIKSEELLEKDRSYNVGEENIDKTIGVINSSPDLSFVADIPRNLKTFWKKYFHKEGGLPQKVFERQVSMKGEAASLAHDLSSNIKTLKKAVGKDYEGRLTSERIVQLNKALSGEIPLTDLPVNTRNAIIEMRSHVDKLSKIMIDNGLVEGPLKDVLQKNLGSYLTRTYRVHDVPKWAEKVPFEVVNRAKSFIRNQYAEKGQKLSENQLQGVINELLYKFDEQTPVSILAGGKLGSKDLSILKKRGDIAPEIRALWGEYSDPMVNYAKSVAKMSNLISRSKFLRDVKKMGMDDFLFTEPNAKHYKEIAGEGSKAMDPLNGLYTTPEIKAAFESFKDAPVGKWMSAYMKINGFTKYAKTILSFPITHVRNFLSNPLIMIRNGNVSLGQIPNAARTVINELAGSTNKQIREKYKKYTELGLTEEGLNYEDIKATLKDANKEMDSFETMTDGTVRRTLRKGTEFLEKAYKHEDVIYKIYSFEAEKAKYRSAYPEWSEAKLDQHAAEVVRATTPTYGEVPLAIRNLRRFPLVGTFVSFPYEIIRTTINNTQLGVKELQNPKTRSIGAKRLAGTMAAMTAYTAVSEWSKAVNNVSDQDDKDIRRFLAPWMKNSELVYLKNNQGGSYQILDASNTDPHNYLKKPIIAMMQGEDPKEAFIDAMQESLSPFLSEEMLLSKILDVRRNKTQTGATVYNEQDEIGKQMADQWGYLMKAFEPGSAAGLRKIVGGLAGELDPKTGKPYDYQTEAINQFTGQKIYEINVPKNLGFKWSKLDKDIGEAKKIYNSALYSKGATEEDIAKAYERSNKAVNKLLKEAHEDFNSAIRLGVPVDEVEDILASGRLNAEQMNAIIDGTEYELPEKERR